TAFESNAAFNSHAAVGDIIEHHRQAIAHEIHDGLLPQLFFLRSRLQQLAARLSGDDQQAGKQHDGDQQDIDAGDECQSIIADLQSAMDQGRRLLTTLHPPQLDSMQWTDALADQLRHEPMVRFHFAESAGGVPDPVALAAFRIAQEATRNAIRHANATTILVTATRTEEPEPTLLIQIIDDGDGFDTTNIEKGRFGLVGMRQRSELLGGTWVCESKIGPDSDSGTRIECRLPLPAASI
ncbi:MAG: ATP-binding protein, partial [Planctomycetota bacterium]